MSNLYVLKIGHCSYCNRYADIIPLFVQFSLGSDKGYALQFNNDIANLREFWEKIDDFVTHLTITEFDHGVVAVDEKGYYNTYYDLQTVVRGAQYLRFMICGECGETVYSWKDTIIHEDYVAHAECIKRKSQ